jgi:hypothetical protein
MVYVIDPLDERGPRRGAARPLGPYEAAYEVSRGYDAGPPRARPAPDADVTAFYGARRREPRRR